jgi:chromosome segregation ATPase
MATFLKTLRPNGDDLRTQVDQIVQNKQQLQALVDQASRSASELSELSTPISAAQQAVVSIGERLTALENRMSAVDRLGSRLGKVEAVADKVAEAQTRIEAQLAQSAADAGKISGQMDDLRHTAEMATTIKDDIAELAKEDSPFQQLRSDADELSKGVRDLNEGFTRIRERQDEMSRAYKHAMSRFNAFEVQYQGIAKVVDDTETRVNGLQDTMESLGELAEGVSDARHQLATINVFTDQIGQKVAALEKQREAIDQAASCAANLTASMREIDAGMQKQADYQDKLEAVTQTVERLQALHKDVLARSDEITARQGQIEWMEQGMKQGLADLQEKLSQSTERFELENRGLETVSQRIADLRSTVSDCENRYSTLDERSRVIAELRSQAEDLVKQVGSVGEDLQHLEEEAGHARTLRAEVERLAEGVGAVTQRLTRVEEAKPAIESALKDLGSLGRSREAMQENLEQMRLVYNEIMRIREGQSETEAWLATTEESLVQLQEQVAGLDSMAPTVEAVRKECELVSDSMAAIQSRGEFVDDLHKRLGELAALGAEIDARSKGLESRVETVEERFVALASKSEDADRVAKAMGTVTASVEDAERRMAEVSKTMGSLENRSDEIQSLSEQVGFIGRELDQRQATIEKATDHLQRASKLREEIAGDIQRLEELSQAVASTAGSVEERAGQLDAMAERLGNRSQTLAAVEKRFDGFEEQLKKWELSEAEMSRALDRLDARQTTVDSLQADIKHMFEMAERTVQDARTISTVQHEMQATRGELEETLERLRASDQVAEGLDERKRAIEQAEGRLARAEALLIDIQSSLETLESQKAMVDYVVKKAGALTFQTKQAEALIDALREERELTNRVQTAFARLRDDGNGKGQESDYGSDHDQGQEQEQEQAQKQQE